MKNIDFQWKVTQYFIFYMKSNLDLLTKNYYKG